MKSVGVDARCLSQRLTGIGKYCLNLCRALQAHGFRLKLFSPRNVPIQELGLEMCELVNGDCSSRAESFYWQQFVLPDLLSRESLDIFWGPSHRLPLRLNSSAVKVLTVHDLVWRQVPFTMKFENYLAERLFMPKSLCLADIVFTSSEATKNQLLAYMPDLDGKTFCIGSGVPSPYHEKQKPQQSIATLEKFSLLDRDFILAVGTNEPRKNLGRLIQAYFNLPSELLEKYDLVLAGSKGWNAKKLQTDKGCTNKPNVHWLDYVTEQQLSALYAKASCFIFPSLYEGFGLPILEAQRQLTPVITSNNSSMPEVAGKSALFIDPYQISDITEKMITLLSSSQLRNSLSRSGYSNSTKYSWHHCAALFDQHVSKVIM